MNIALNKARIVLATLSLSLVTGCSTIPSSRTHIVSFDTDGGTYIAPQTVEHGEKVAKPQDPEKEGYSFNGWYYQEEEWSFAGYVVTEDMTLKADFSICEYRVSIDDFDDHYGSIYIPNQADYYEYGTSVTLIAMPWSGYSFAGYYDSQSGYLLSNDPDYTFVIKRHMNIRVDWVAGHGPYSVLCDSNVDGSISVSKTRANPGDIVDVHFQPNQGYKLSNAYLVVDGRMHYACLERNHDIEVASSFYTNGDQIVYNKMYIYLWNDNGDRNADFPGREIENNAINFETLNRGRNDSNRYTKFIISAEGKIYVKPNPNGSYVSLSNIQTIDLTVADWVGCSYIKPFDKVTDNGNGYYGTPREYDKNPFVRNGNNFTMLMPDGGVLVNAYFDSI